MDYSHGQNRVPVNVRVPVDLHQQLTIEAERSVRTVSSEIVYRLRQSLAADKPPGQAEGATS
jgi:Arc-like DNA binding domain